MNHAERSPHRATLTVSAEQIPPGYATHLSWKVVGVEANVASVHLASGIDGGLCMIEGTHAEGSREVIFTHTGTYTFTLTATFGDGVKLSRHVSVRVRD